MVKKGVALLAVRRHTIKYNLKCNTISRSSTSAKPGRGSAGLRPGGGPVVCTPPGRRGALQAGRVRLLPAPIRVFSPAPAGRRCRLGHGGPVSESDMECDSSLSRTPLRQAPPGPVRRRPARRPVGDRPTVGRRRFVCVCARAWVRAIVRVFTCAADAAAVAAAAVLRALVVLVVVETQVCERAIVQVLRLWLQTWKHGATAGRVVNLFQKKRIWCTVTDAKHTDHIMTQHWMF